MNAKVIIRTTMKNKVIYISDIRSNVNEGKSTGHFVPVARMYCELFNDTCKVIVAGGPIYEQYFSKEQLHVLPYNISGTSIRDKWHTMLNALSLFRRAKGETIVLQHSSVVTCFVAITLLYWKTSKLYLIQYSNDGVSSRLKRLLYSLCKWKIDGIICPNERVANAFGLPSCIIPDYIYTNLKIPQCRKYEDKKYDFCIVGRIAKEKGVVEVAQFFTNTSYSLLIAGKPQDNDLANILQDTCDEAKNITLHLGYISDKEYIESLNNSKYAILNYQKEYFERSSGVVFDTLFNGVPVIGKKCPTLDFIEKYQCGELFTNILEFDPSTVLDSNTYYRYIGNIKKYQCSHKAHHNSLIKFLTNG